VKKEWVVEREGGFGWGFRGLGGGGGGGGPGEASIDGIPGCFSSPNCCARFGIFYSR